MRVGKGSRANSIKAAPSVTPDEEALLDEAIDRADQRLVASLETEELRRRRRRRWSLGGVGMILLIAGIVAGLMISSAGVSPADAERAAALSAEASQLWHAGRWAEAEAKFEAAVKLNPESVNAWNGLGWSRFNGGDATGAEQAFKRCIELHATQLAAANNGLGQIYFFRRQYEEAEKYLLKAAPLAPASWWALGKMYLLQGKYEEAAKWWQKVANQQPGDELVKKLLAAAKAEKLDADLRRLIEPPEPTASSEATRRGWSLLNRGMIEHAMKEFRETLKKNPNETEAHNGLGFCLVNSGRFPEAKEHFEKCLQLQPGHAGAMNGLAQCLKAEGKVAQAIELWEKAVKQHPSADAAMVGLAWTYLEQGKYDKALKYFEQLAKMMPDNPTIKDGLQRARKGLKTKK